MIRTAVGWLIFAVVVIYFIKHGGQVGDWVHQAAHSVSAFISSATS